MKRLQTLWILVLALHLEGNKTKPHSAMTESAENFQCKWTFYNKPVCRHLASSHVKTQSQSFCAEENNGPLFAWLYFFLDSDVKIFLWDHMQFLIFINISIICFLMSLSSYMLRSFISFASSFRLPLVTLSSYFPSLLRSGQCWGRSMKFRSSQNQDSGVCTVKLTHSF